MIEKRNSKPGFIYSGGIIGMGLVLALLSACTGDASIYEWLQLRQTETTNFPTATLVEQIENNVEQVPHDQASDINTETQAPAASSTEDFQATAVKMDETLATPEILSTASNIVAEDSSTDLPAATLTSTPLPPFAYLQIKKPGENSFVVSPIYIEAMINPGDDGLLHADLFGEDGRIIAHQEFDYRYAVGNRFWTSPKLNYSIDSVAELGRLVLSVYDHQSRIIALSTVDLYLQSMGRYEIEDPARLREVFAIRYPYHNAEIEGGIVYINGLASPINDNPVIFELIDDNRTVIGSWELDIPKPQGDQTHTQFTVQIPYVVYATTPVRLIIRQESDTDIPGNVAVSSMRLILEP